MQRRHSLHALGALAVAAALPQWAGCAAARPMHMGMHTWIGYETIHLAQDFKWLPGDVQVQTFSDINANSQALAAGQLDCACLTLDEVLRLRAAGIALSVGLVFDVSAGADAVVAMPRIRQLSDLAGQRIGVEAGALGALMLSWLLKAARLTKADVRVVDMPSERHVRAWQRGEVDALICYEPNVTLLQRNGAHRIFDSRQMPDTIVDVLAVRLDRAAQFDQSLRNVVRAHFRGLEHLKTNRQDALYRIASHQGILPDEAQRALGGVVQPTLAANRQYLSTAQQRLLPAARGVSRLMVEAGLLAQEDSMAQISNPTWLPGDDG